MNRRCGPLGALLAALVISACGSDRVTVQAVAQVVPTPVAVPRAPTPVVPAGCSRRARACVSTVRRLAWIQYEGRLADGPVRVGLGRASQPTPHGSFRVAWKDAEHTSSIYGTDMPFSVFFAAGGIAFHQGPVDELSHGCVHLPRAAAAAFFEALQPGDRVEVF